MHNNLIGNLGEQSVAQYLQGKKYKIVGNNFRTKFGEIDLIALAPDKTLVFIEVKALIKNPNSKSNLSPEDNVTTAKLKKFQKIAEYYAGLHPELINEKNGWRIDVVAFECLAENLHNPLQFGEFRHYENI